MNSNKTIGEKISELLDVRRMNQSELAKQSGVSKSLICMLISNERQDTTVSTVRKLSSALGVHPAYFIEDDTLGPSDLLPYMTPEQRAKAMSAEEIPWIKLRSKAEVRRITPETLSKLIDALS